MAAPWKLNMSSYCALIKLPRLLKLSKFTFNKCFEVIYYSANAFADEYSQVAEYPPIKSKYPPCKGGWGKTDHKAAWEYYNYGQELLQIADPRERLEKIAGTDDITMWHLRYFCTVKTYNYSLWATKTSSVQGLPDIYSKLDVRLPSLALKNIVLDALKQFADQKKCTRNKNTEKYIIDHGSILWARSSVGTLLRTLVSSLSEEYDYFRRAQIDEDVRMETFWYKNHDLAGKDFHGKLKKDWFLKYQTKFKADFQIRSENPLPLFVAENSSLCMGSATVSEVDSKPDLTSYSPWTYWIKRAHYRPTTVSGHWIGDPSDFTPLGIYLPNEFYYKALNKWGENMKTELISECGLLTSFTSCLSQAYNQGFGMYHELTYPITTQTIFTDGRSFRFFCYQLNTLHLWKDDDANSHSNLIWSTDLMPLYDTIEDGHVKGFRDDTFKLLLQFLLNTPEDRGIQLKPFYSAWESKKKFINIVGEPPIQHPPIGRTQYPRYPVYF